MYIYTIVKRINDKSLFLIVMIVYHFSNEVAYGKKWVSKTLRISELYLSFSPHPNISDGNFNLVHHFFCIQIFQINEKGSR